MLVADANVFVAVVMNEPSKPWIVGVTRQKQLVAPASLPFEIGNALIALFKRRLLGAEHIGPAFQLAREIPVELREIDVEAALKLASDKGLYAYDGYMLQCAVEVRAPFLTLDKKLRKAAREAGVEVME